MSRVKSRAHHLYNNWGNSKDGDICKKGNAIHFKVVVCKLWMAFCILIIGKKNKIETGDDDN